MLHKRLILFIEAALLASISTCLLSTTAIAQPCQTPNMLIVLDVSTSMEGTIGNTTKWDAAKAAVISVTNKYGTAASANKIRFGLELFANPDAYSHTKCCFLGSECSSCGGFCGSCGTHSHTQVDGGECTVNAINVGVADNNAAAILAKLGQSQVAPWSTTPIAGALNYANTYSALKDGTRGDFVLLVTDGVEECEVSAGEYCTMCVSAATALKNNGIKSYVVGFGSGVDTTNLNDMATAGGTAKAGSTKYYQADNQADLEAALDVIASQVASGSCTIPGKLGECAKGEKQCSGGVVTCVQVHFPETEQCDNLDNDCDGTIDNGLTQACAGACGGFQTCTAGQWSTCSAGEPKPEICNGIDDDCDGTIDNGDPGGGVFCVTGMPGVCAAGTTHCIGGTVRCVPNVSPSPEVCDGLDNDCDGVIDNGVRNKCGLCGALPAEACNGKDDDCDGVIDNGATCPDPGSVCLNGECVVNCINNECPKGEVCRESDGTWYCVNPCNGVKCDPPLKCHPASGECFDPCQGVQCKENEICRDGDCVSKDCHESGCPEGQICVGSVCIGDPCANVTCKPEEQCVNGICEPSCAAVSCTLLQHCENGKCVDDPCANITCAEGKKCVEGNCIDDPCQQKQCGKGYICVDDTCVDDPCLQVKCPDGQQCRDGTCYYEVTPFDAGTSSDGGTSADGALGQDGSLVNDGAVSNKDGGKLDGSFIDGGGSGDDSGGGHRDGGGGASDNSSGTSSDCSCSSVDLNTGSISLGWMISAFCAIWVVVRRRRR